MCLFGQDVGLSNSEWLFTPSSRRQFHVLTLRPFLILRGVIDGNVTARWLLPSWHYANGVLIMAQSYKTLKENFVSGLSGGTILEINYVTAVAPVNLVCPS